MGDPRDAKHLVHDRFPELNKPMPTPGKHRWNRLHPMDLGDEVPDACFAALRDGPAHVLLPRYAMEDHAAAARARTGRTDISSRDFADYLRATGVIYEYTWIKDPQTLGEAIMHKGPVVITDGMGTWVADGVDNDAAMVYGRSPVGWTQKVPIDDVMLIRTEAMLMVPREDS